MSHCGPAGHRGQAVTPNHVKDKFTWIGIADDINTFDNKCLHCQSTKGQIRVTREKAHTLHASRPKNFDYLYMSEGEQNWKYIIILKGDFSSFVWLVKTRNCDTDSAVAAMKDWITNFGASKTRVSDQGSHFKNEVMAKLAASLGTRHHFTSAYHAQSNATVEVVYRETIRACRALLFESKLGPKVWSKFTSTIQSVLNNSKTSKLGKELAPITSFTMLPPMNPLAELFPVDTASTEFKTLSLVKAAQLIEFAKFHDAIHEMYRRVSAASQAKRAADIERHNKATNVTAINFDVGDLVLIGCPQPQKVNKLTVTWTGPARVLGFTTPLVAKIQNLLGFELVVGGKVRDIHVSRLKFYNSATLDVTEELKEHLTYQQKSLYLVDKFKEMRRSTRRKFEVLVSWVGFPGEDTWEELKVLAENVPVRLLECFNSTEKDSVTTAELKKVQTLLKKAGDKRA